MSDDAPEDMQELGRRRAAQARSLPTTYVDPINGQQYSRAAPVVGVTEEEIRRYGHGGHTCGECRFFEQGHAPAEMARTKFLTVLSKDHELNPKHFGMTRERPEEIGLCAAAGDMATTVFAPACDQFRESKGRLKREAKPEELAVVVKDMRAANRTVDERFQKFKRDHNLNSPEYVEE